MEIYAVMENRVAGLFFMLSYDLREQLPNRSHKEEALDQA